MRSPRILRARLFSLLAGLSLSLASACGGEGGGADTTSTATTPGASGSGSNSGGPGSGGTPTTGKPDPNEPVLVEARALYASRCALCHGDKGQGFAADGANALANGHFLSIASDDLIRSGIKRGRVVEGTPMPAFGVQHNGTLTDAQIDGLTKLIRSWETMPRVDLNTVQVPPGTPGRGLALYQIDCERCHGPEGRGATRNDGYMSLNDPDFLAHANDAYLYRSIVDGRPGAIMPSFKHLTQQQIGDLVALIRSWQRPIDDTPLKGPPNDLENAILNPGGAEPEFTLRDNKYVSVDQVHKQVFEENRKVILLDAREPSDWIRRRIKGARNVPFYDASKLAARVPKGAYIVTYCGCPHAASGAAADALRAAGFDRVAVLDEGFWIWDDKQYPVAVADEK